MVYLFYIFELGISRNTLNTFNILIKRNPTLCLSDEIRIKEIVFN